MPPLTAKANHPDFRPWYREPWPWVLIAIPVLTVIACAITLWLALTHPDYLAVEDDEYQAVKAGLQAQPQSASETDAVPPDGDH